MRWAWSPYHNRAELGLTPEGGGEGSESWGDREERTGRGIGGRGDVGGSYGLRRGRRPDRRRPAAVRRGRLLAEHGAGLGSGSVHPAARGAIGGAGAHRRRQIGRKSMIGSQD
jgi:hypothetical protein